MKKFLLIVVVALSFALIALDGFSQCSICTKTAQQLGDEAGQGLNGGILYLAAAPLLIVGFIGYQWWKNNQSK